MKMIEVKRKRHHHLALFPLMIMLGVGLAIWLAPPQEYDVTPAIRPPVAEAGAAVPTTIVSVAQGQPVGDEAYFEGFRLNTGWHLAQTATYGRYDLDATVTNVSDSPDIARVLVTIRVGERNVEMLMCRVSLSAGETGILMCADTHHADYSPRWSRVTLSAS